MQGAEHVWAGRTQQDIAGLYISMDDTLTVRVFQRAGNRGKQIATFGNAHSFATT